MSTKALRRLQNEKEDPLQEILKKVGGDVDQDGSDEDKDEYNVAAQSASLSKKNKKKRKQLNSFNLLNQLEIVDDENNTETPEIENETKPVDDVEELENSPKINGTEKINGTDNDKMDVTQKKKKKRKRKKIKENKSTENESCENKEVEDEIDASIREVNMLLGDIGTSGDNGGPASSPITFSMKALLSVEHKNLNPDNEMRRIFGSRVIQAEQRRNRNSRQRTHLKTSRLCQPKDTWAPYAKTGLTMNLLENRRGYQYFEFEHNTAYREVQFLFLDAVESLNPQTIVDLLHLHPYHIGGLIQLGEIFRMSEDMAAAAELIEKALYAFESAFHPLFSLTNGNCRLDYRKPENRGFFLCLFKHLLNVGQKGCYRTALELCKLLLSVDSEDDPLCVLLCIDFYAVRSEQYEFLIRLYEEWEAHRNLSQLPNFGFSIPLCKFHLANGNEDLLRKADDLLQRSLMMYPGALMPLLEKCGITPDPSVTGHHFFQSSAASSQTESLKQIINLYVHRTYSCWKEPEVMEWLERNVRAVLALVDSKCTKIEEYRQQRLRRYQGTPRNILRHIILSEIKDVTANLPPELANTPVLSYDPLPPTDSFETYQRPGRPTQAQEASNPLSLFLRSMLPNFNANEPVPEEERGAVGGDEGRNNLQQGVGALMTAMRELLNNIRPVDPPIENQHIDEERDPSDNEDDWA